MPKVDINAAFSEGMDQSKSRRKMARSATTVLLGGNAGIGISGFDEASKLSVKSIPYEKLRKRDVNDFSEEADINSLAESIRLYGLINPLSVVWHPDEDIYVISAGHRRYKAIGILRERYPNDSRFEKVDCAVYEVTEDNFKLKQGLPYISKEQEEGIYRDSNLENRQLSYQDVATQIRYIVGRFEDPDYIKNIRDELKEQGIGTYGSNTDKVKLIINVLSTQNYSGWSRETIRQYLQVMDSGRNDLLDKIESGELKVKAAYKLCNEEQHRKRYRKTTKITRIRDAVQQFCDEAKTRTYEQYEIDELKGYIAKLQEIVDKNEPK